MLTVLLVGAGLGIAMHWIECLIRPSLYQRKLNWIIFIRIPEGILVAAAMRMLNAI